MVRRRQPTQQLEPATALPARWVGLIGADGALVRQPLGRRRLRKGPKGRRPG